MAKRNHSVTQAIEIMIGAIRAEHDTTLTAEQKSAVINQAMDCIQDSDVLTVGEIADEGIDFRLEADRMLTEAGIDPAQFRRQQALGPLQAILGNGQIEGQNRPQIEG